MRLTWIIALAVAVGLSATSQSAPTPKPAASPANAKGVQRAGPEHGAGRDTIHVVTDDFVLARVGPNKITALDFRNRYWLGAEAGRPVQDSSGRAEFLERMIDKEVLTLTALEANKPLTFENRLTLRAHTYTVLQNTLYQRLVLDSVNVTAADTDAKMYQFTYDQHLRMILFVDRATAEKVRLQLLRGRISWREAVRRYNQDREAGPEGDRGWIRRTALRGELALVAFDLKPGTFSEPLLAPEGYRLIQCVERRPSKTVPIKFARIALMSDLRQARTRPYAARFYDRVRRESKVVYDTTTLMFVAAKFREQLETTPRPDKFTIDMRPQLPDFAPGDTARVMARTVNRTITLGQFLAELSEVPGALRPQFASLEPLIHSLDGPTLAKERNDLALAMGIDRDSITLALVEKKRVDLLVDHLYQDSILNHVQVTTEERRRYYEEHRREMTSPARMRHARFLCADLAAADSVLAQLRSGQKAEDLINLRSLQGDDSTASIFEVSERDNDPFKGILLQELKPGQAAREGPDRDGIYVVLQALEYTPGHELKFEDVGGAVDESLTNMEAERLFKEFLARRRPYYPIKVEHPMLMRVWLTDPSLDYVERRHD